MARTMVDKRGDTVELMRVVHYPGVPADLGVVIRTVTTRRDYGGIGRGYIATVIEHRTVLWHDGHDDPIDAFGRLYEHEDRPRVVTVTRSVRECRRLLEQYENAPVGAEATR